jgi:hypothetical protein
LLAGLYRKRRTSEIISYIAVGIIELALFAFTLMLRLGILRHIPFHLPPGLPFNRAEIGATIAIAVGLFPAAYWHRTSLAQLRQRIARDAKVMQQRKSGVQVRGDAPGEWMN